jgi:hypothetical protein
MVSWEIYRYKCQIKGASGRWETINTYFTEEYAVIWLKSEMKHGEYPCRVIREEFMQITQSIPKLPYKVNRSEIPNGSFLFMPLFYPYFHTFLMRFCSTIKVVNESEGEQIKAING